MFCCLKISTIGVLGYNGGMDNKILPTDEYVTFEDRAYLNPNLAVTETNQFIDNLRNTQQANNAQINQQTQRLGTDVPSDMGGLTGAQSYWTSRYQTPQTNSAVADLRATAQATALNEALANEKAKWQKRYNDAYNAYQKRSWDNQNSNGGGSGGSSKLPVDVNNDPGNGTTNENTNTGPGKYVPVTDFVGDYLSEDGSQWWMLSSLMRADEINLNDRAIQNVKNGDTIVRNGITYMYLENDQFPNGRWFRATLSAGPETYSPYAGVNNG